MVPISPTPAIDQASTGVAEDPRRQAARDCLTALCDCGVSLVVIVTTEDQAACRACHSVVGRIYGTAVVPLPPIEGCEIECCCEIAALLLE